MVGQMMKASEIEALKAAKLAWANWKVAGPKPVHPAVHLAAAMVAAPVVKSTRTVRFSLWASVAIIPITWTR